MKYGWTPQQVDETEAVLLDWLLGIMKIEGEIIEEDREKQEAKAKAQQGRAQRRMPRTPAMPPMQVKNKYRR